MRVQGKARVYKGLGGLGLRISELKVGGKPLPSFAEGLGLGAQLCLLHDLGAEGALLEKERG